MYDVGDYDVKLQIPTDNYVAYSLYPHDLEPIQSFLEQISVVNKQTLIVLFGGFQCLQERDFWIQPINEFAKKTSNPLAVFTGKLTSDSDYDLPKINFLYHRISMFDLVSNFYWNQRHENKNRDWTNDCYRCRNTKFYWASTKDWYSRRYILAGLINNNLLNDGSVNYKCLYTDIPGPWIQHRIESIWAAHIDQECHSISNQIPLPALDNTVEFTQTNVNFYLDSYVGIITDTYFNTGVFFSEKVFNAMNYQQLFFYIGHQGSLKYLKSQGYEIFDNVIDTSYDDIQEPGARLVAARKSLINFLTQPIEKIRDAYNNNIDAIKHNKQLVQKQRPDIQLTNVLQKYLNEH